MIRITTFAGKRVAVFGLGASGIATAKALVAGGADVVASDDSAAGMQAAAEAGLKTADLKETNWAIFASLVLAPGVPLTHPQPHWTVRAAKLAGVEVIGDLELFVRERRAQKFHVPLIAITGTNGKSTTTALTAHILQARPAATRRSAATSAPPCCRSRSSRRAGTTSSSARRIRSTWRRASMPRSACCST